MRRPRLAFAVLPVACLAFAGCGGSDSTTADTTPTPPPTATAAIETTATETTTPLTGEQRADAMVECLNAEKVGDAGRGPSEKPMVLLSPAAEGVGAFTIEVARDGTSVSVAHFDAPKAVIDRVMACVPEGRGLTRRETFDLFAQPSQPQPQPYTP